jgi:hypothetical protein
MFPFGSKKQKGGTPRRRLPAQQDDQEIPVAASNGQFRRNQTLSSYRHTTPEESSRQKAHQLTVQRRKLGSIFAVVFVVVILLLLLLWQLIGQVTVATSTKQLSQPFTATAYEQSINEYLGINPAQRLRFALNQGALSDFVSGQLPEVEKVTLSGSPGLAHARFAITFRTPVAGWQINSKQYYVDANGVVFQKNYYTSPAVQIVDESGISPEEGTQVAGTRLLGFLGRIVAGAGERGYSVTRALLPAGTTRQVDIYLKDIPTRVKFSIDRGAGEQVEDMDRVFKFLNAQNNHPSYIDVRVTGKAAYQ